MRVLAAKFAPIFPHLDERQRRQLIGAEGCALGHGGHRADHRRDHDPHHALAVASGSWHTYSMEVSLLPLLVVSLRLPVDSQPLLQQAGA